MDKLVSKRYFDINQDLAVIKDGGFFCQACLVGKEKTATSPDPRYCQDCYDFLREAMETDTRWRHSASMPKLLVDEAKASRHQNYTGSPVPQRLKGIVLW